jgi:hypothetical protein
MVVIQEFDLDIKPTKIVRGQGLCKLATESQDLVEPENSGWDNELSLWCSEVLYIPPESRLLVCRFILLPSSWHMS